MDIQSKIEYLSGLDLFHSFSNEDIKRFAEETDEVTYPAGKQIFQEGDAGSDMYILLAGSIRIFKGNRFITVIEPVDYVGEMSILEKRPRSATATALTPVHLLRITSSQFEKFLANQPLSLVSMMKTLSTRIRKDTELISEEFNRANILIHDMRNRLSAFLLLDYIKGEHFSKKTIQYFKIMRHSYSDLAGMMDEALANAKRLKYIPTHEKISVNLLVDDLLHSEFILHEALQGKSILTDIPPDLPELCLPPNDLRRVLTNLVINAGQASKPGSEIYLKAEHRNGEIKISVTDTGCGIPEKFRLKIFEPHFTTRKEGNGFGLASCKEIVEKDHHGRLEFQTSPQGTTFIFSLPLPHNTGH
jgi:signal transduction histidine kinase